MQDIGIDLGGRMHNDDGGADGAADAAMHLDFFRRHGPDHGALAADRDLLAHHITADIAVDLQLVLRDDRNVLAKYREVGTYH